MAENVTAPLTAGWLQEAFARNRREVAQWPASFLRMAAIPYLEEERNVTAPLTAANVYSAEIRSLHKAIEYPAHCDACSERWPCTQIEIADELDRLAADLAQKNDWIRKEMDSKWAALSSAEETSARLWQENARLTADLAHARERIAYVQNLVITVGGERDRLSEDRAQMRYTMLSARQSLRQPPYRARDRLYVLDSLEDCLGDIDRRDDERAAALAARVPAEGEM